MPLDRDTLQTLRPDEKPNVIDLLREVGLDVSRWSVSSKGSKVESPATNGLYCYNWSFGSPSETIVLCVWHETLRADGDRIVYSEPMRTQCEQLYEIASDPKRTSTERHRTRQQAARARRFYLQVKRAYEQLLPVRLIINEGDMRSRSEYGSDSSRVVRRRLDNESWYVHEYNERTGEGLLVRGQKPARDRVDALVQSTADDDNHGPDDVRQLRAINVRRGQQEFRDRVLSAWSRRCIVTSCHIDGLLEAAHIIPHAEETDYRTSNGLLLRADIHTLYDLGLLSFDENMRVHLAPQLLASEYKIYDRRKIKQRPNLLADEPSVVALRTRHNQFLQLWSKV